MFEKADAEFAELSQKKQILHLDKDKIEKVRPAYCGGTDYTTLQSYCRDKGAAMPSICHHFNSV